MRVGVERIVDDCHSAWSALHVEAVLHLLNLAYGIADFVGWHTQFHRHDNGGEKVGDVAFAHKTRFERHHGAAFFVCHVEAGAVFRIFNVARGVVGVCGGLHGIAQARSVVNFAIGHVWKVIVDHAEAVGRESVGKLELCALHILYRFERFHVLLAHSGYYAVLRMHDVADFLDVSALLGAHLADENFGVRLQHLADGAGHAHWSVEAARSHHHVELFAKDAVQIMLGACLAVTARDADHLQRRHFADDAARVVDIAVVD